MMQVNGSTATVKNQNTSTSTSYDDLTVEEYLQERYSQLVCGLKLHTEELINQLEEDFNQGKEELLQMSEIDNEDIEMYMKHMQQDSGSEEESNENNSSSEMEMEVDGGVDHDDIKMEKTENKRGGGKRKKQGLKVGTTGRRNTAKNTRNGQNTEENIENKISSDEEDNEKRKRKQPPHDKNKNISEEDENDPAHQNQNTRSNRKSSSDNKSSSAKKLSQYRKQIDEMSKLPTRVLLVVVDGAHKGNQYDLKRKLPSSPNKEITTTKGSRRIQMRQRDNESTNNAEDDNKKDSITTFLIGRSKAKAYRVDGVSLHSDSEVSSEHGKIEMDEKGVATYTDLDSTNGSFYNENLVKPFETIVLETGTKLQVGKSILEVTII